MELEDWTLEPLEPIRVSLRKITKSGVTKAIVQNETPYKFVNLGITMTNKRISAVQFVEAPF